MTLHAANIELVRIGRDDLTGFCECIFRAVSFSPGDAAIAAEVLVAADARGIPSHGVARLPIYLGGVRNGTVIPSAATEVLAETGSTLVADAHGAMGAPASVYVMERLIEKAAGNGAAFGCVRESNHFGIAGYYAMLALPSDMLGFAMTNTATLGVPTFGKQVMYGTNPIAFAAPANEERAFVLDMSTTVVTKGKIEVYERHGQPLPSGWAVDKTGHSAQDPQVILDDMWNRVGGGLLPLGGEGETLSGYKGYGLAVMVDILCAVLCGGAFGPAVADTVGGFGRVSHFFGAIKVAAFRDPAAFRADMDRMLRDLRQSALADGAERIYVAGQKEFEKEAEYAREGIPLLTRTYEQLCALGREHGIEPPGPFAGRLA
jgi:L-2-hydroxycarboxylate dehydrogenase (NAD+)